EHRRHEMDQRSPAAERLDEIEYRRVPPGGDAALERAEIDADRQRLGLDAEPAKRIDDVLGLHERIGRIGRAAGGVLVVNDDDLPRPKKGVRHHFPRRMDKWCQTTSVPTFT